jgi:restriction endonuclease S subunit
VQEQDAIVEVVESFMERCDELEARLRARETEATLLAEALTAVPTHRETDRRP